MSDEIECPLTANPCRHCSNEHEYRPYMKLDKDPRTSLYKPGGLGKIEIDLGHRCNNVCCWVDELETCPVPNDLINQGEMIEEYNANKEKDRVKSERKEEREKAKRKSARGATKKKSVGKVVKKPVVKKRPIMKPMKKKVVTKDVKKRKL